VHDNHAKRLDAFRNRVPNIVLLTRAEMAMRQSAPSD
jgi:hypothetical protein